MTMDPYRVPDATSSVSPLPGTGSRTLFLLAGTGALLASAYWAGLTLLIGLSASDGSASSSQLLVPCFLIGLYAWRGVQIIKGDVLATQRIMWLHGVGGAMAVFQMSTSSNSWLVTLQSVKLAIHAFGLATAFLARRSYFESASRLG